VTTSTVAAILTILGYSLYDVVIVFDRIRENAPRMPRAAFTQIVNRSMSDVLTRSLATSMSTLMGIAAIFLFGGETLQDFAFALLVGIVSGTYSSIFIAAPVLTEWKEREPAFKQRRRRIEADQGYVPAYAATPGAVKADEPTPARRRGRRDEAAVSEPAPEPASPVATMPLEPEGDGVPSDGADGTNGAPTYDPDEQPAPVGGDGVDAAATEAARAERAERKKQRQQRQRSRRKHGRRR
jgi:SecD/SecF fusion protein